MENTLDHNTYYRIVCARDGRYDGRFFTGVLSTGIYCRPVCPARTPKKENCVFLPSASAAEIAGFRPCLRCRPELAPHLPGGQGTSATVNRALRLIDEGALNENSVEELANRLGIGERHLRRLFMQHLGASPKKVAQNRRLLLARQLVCDTALPLSHVALAAGFQSLRRFNDSFQKAYRTNPRQLRRKKKSAGSNLCLRLGYQPPLDWTILLNYLKVRAIAGVENITKDHYRRTFRLKGEEGWFEIYPVRAKDELLVEINYPDITALPLIIGRIRRLFDLDANINVINQQLAQSSLLAPLISQTPGLRVPGAWEPFELGVRAILGQQISVKAATTLLSRLVKKTGDPVAGAVDGLSYYFPRPEALIEGNLDGLGITAKRVETLKGLSRQIIEKPGFFTDMKNSEQAIKQLCTLKGIGLWTAQYIAMRALGDVDIFPQSDLVLLKNSGQKSPGKLVKIAEEWRPWRAYGAMHLWNMKL